MNLRTSLRSFRYWLGLVALLPAWRVVSVLSADRARNPSNDEVMIVDTIGNLLSGSYPWLHFPRDVFLNGHFEAVPMLVHGILAKAFAWDLGVALCLGFLLTLLRLGFLFLALNAGRRDLSSGLLLGALGFLVLSPSQISTLEFEFVGIQMGLAYLAVAAGIWATLRLNERGEGLWLMIAMGFMAGWSFGGGVLLWPVYLLGMALRGHRCRWHYAAVLCWALLNAFPYLYFLKIHPAHDLYPLVEQRLAEFRLGLSSLLNVSMFVRGVGWPLAQGFDAAAAWRRGAAGLALAAAVLTSVCFGRARLRERPGAVGGILILAFGALSLWQISIFREILAPWYAAPAMFFWIGLLGLACDEWRGLAMSGNRPWGAREGLAALASGAAVACLMYFYATSNLSFEDKTFYRQVRSPVAEACVRNFETAPTYCESRVFQWPHGQFWLLSKLGTPLQRHRLSLFSRDQDWTLQGESFLKNVRWHRDAAVPEIFWTRGLSTQSVPFTDFQRLNLFLHTPNSVEWQVALPPDLERAEFRSAVAIAPAAPESAEADGTTAQVIVAADGKSEAVFAQYLAPGDRQWREFSVPLESYRGRKVTVKLTSQGGKNLAQDWLMFRAPSIHLRLRKATPEPGAESPPAVHPENVDAETPTQEGENFTFPPVAPGEWQFQGLEEAEVSDSGAAGWRVVAAPSVAYSGKVPGCLGDFAVFRVRVAASTEVYPRAVEVILHGDDPAYPERGFFLPLLGDAAAHTYDFDLKLLENIHGFRLKGITLKPVVPPKFFSRARVELGEVSLRGKNPAGACR